MTAQCMQMFPELATYQKIGWKRHRLRQSVDHEISEIGSVRAGRQLASSRAAPEPDPHSLIVGIMEIGVHSKHGSDVGIQTGFFFEFSSGGPSDIFVPFDITAGNAPCAGIRTAALDQKDARFLNDQDRYTDNRVTILNSLAPVAVQAYNIAYRSILQPAATGRTKMGRHLYRSPSIFGDYMGEAGWYLTRAGFVSFPKRREFSVN